MTVSTRRVEEILNYLDENGEEKALSYFGINLETLRRYQRRSRYKETKKAKILLQLALQQTNETENIQKIFDTY